MSSMNKKILVLLIIVVLIGGFWFLAKIFLQHQALVSEQAATKAQLKEQDEIIENIINSRRLKNSTETAADPFDEDGIARILLIGLDTRVGQTSGHCDAIQLISIDKNAGAITITAVPRGTYSPLPPGKGTTSTDYYVSNACDLGGLEYGVQQIEKILGVKTDYLVVVGFSETLGILRYLQLPTTETLQWLRNRHGYAIGEPQRAHNHSTFIKQMLIRFAPTEKSILDTPLQYIIYKLVKTDLSFSQAQSIADAITAMDIANHPEKIQLTMRPLYIVQDIAYDSENITEYLDQTIGSIKHLLSKNDYSDVSEETLQRELLQIIEENADNLEFISWVYKNNLWLQIGDSEQSLSVQYNLFTSYLSLLVDKKEREIAITDYIIEMENRGESLWQTKGKNLLAQEMGY